MELKCLSPCCKKYPSLYCYCTEEPQTLCNKHIIEHKDSSPHLFHNIKTIYRVIPIHKRFSMITYLQEEIISLKQKQKSFMSELQKVQVMINTISITVLQNINNKIRMCHSLLKNVLHVKKINTLYRRINSSDKNVNVKDLRFEIMKKFDAIKGKNWKIIYDDIKNFVDMTQNFNYCRSDLKQENIDDCVYFFKPGTTTLLEFDVKGCNTKSFNLTFNENQGYLAGICKIPGNKLFITGGYVNNMLIKDCTFMVDLESKTVEELKKTHKRAMASANYYQNKVYVFGGFSGGIAMRNCDVYDLIEKNWGSATMLPTSVCNTNAVNLKGRFLIAGYQNFLYLYDVKGNWYQEVAKVLVSAYNMIVKNGEKLFLIGVRIYTGNTYDLKNWKDSKKLSISENSTCKPIVRGNYAFYSDWKSNVYRFNCSTLDVEKIMTLG
ncbi:hypothetical protein SteCoe_17416 [Stentor coeruleus]|uniref:Uncharacterized protein n=1 Tax=Stentor coeruleus TaxID=5963 RepID=A0A1R2BZ50_9CILI|nr:hypothetical protein SteCoe_17416 [Stentor coeruleus]